MGEMRTRSTDRIENMMEGMDSSSMRYKVLQSAKSFKTSWVELGQALYTVWKDKLYREWGYNTFDAYTAKEVSIRKQTALKLLRSYSFLEKEEPGYLKSDISDEETPAGAIPTFEAVDALRQAKNNKNLDQADYSRIRKYVLHDGKDAKEVKKDLTQLIRQREELEPEEAREKKRNTILKRFVSSLRSVVEELKVMKLLPVDDIREAEALVKKVEREIQ